MYTVSIRESMRRYPEPAVQTKILLSSLERLSNASKVLISCSSKYKYKMTPHTA